MTGCGILEIGLQKNFLGYSLYLAHIGQLDTQMDSNKQDPARLKICKEIEKNKEQILGNIDMEHIIKKHVDVPLGDGTSGEFIKIQSYKDEDIKKYIKGLIGQAITSIVTLYESNRAKILFWKDDYKTINLSVNTNYIIGKDSKGKDSHTLAIVIEDLNSVKTAYPM